MEAPTDTKLVEALKSVISAHGGVRLALLFGSRAKGRARRDSDVDIAVNAPGVDLAELAARISERVGAEVDVVPLADASIPLLEELITHGVVIWEASRGAAANWRSQTLGQLETDRPWYRRQRDAWLARVASKGLDRGR